MAVTLDSLKKTIKKNKGRSQALAWLADMERASGDFEAALKTVDEALEASPSDVPAMLVRAKILAGQQDFAGCIMEYKKVLSKDPFCLSAHKRMGESYDKLGKVAERNACFRRVHDMDPLDPFWKEEYDVLPEEQSDLVAPPMDDSSFTMDDTAEPETTETTPEDDLFANLAASLPNNEEEDHSAMDSLRNSLNSASDENFQNVDQFQDSDLDGHVLNSSEVSSAIAGILGGDDDLDISEDDGSKSGGSLFSLDDIDSEEKATNVDDAFSSIFGNDELPEEKPAEEAATETVDTAEVADADLTLDEEPAEKLEESAGGLFEKSADAEFSLNDSADEVSLEEKPEVEEEKATNVNDAFSSIFGDDELPEEKPAEEVADTAGFVDATEAAEVGEATNNAEAPEIAEVADAAETADADLEVAETADAVDDDLTLDETQAETSEDADNSSIPSTHMDFSDEEDLPSEDTVLDLDEATDELKAETESSAEEGLVDDSSDSLGGLFEKSADADWTLDETPTESSEPAEELTAEAPVAEELVLEEPVQEDTAALETPAEELQENPQEEQQAEESVQEEPATESLADEQPALEEPSAEQSLELPGDSENTAIPSMHMDFSDDEVLHEDGNPENILDEAPLNLDEPLDAPLDLDAAVEDSSVETQSVADADDAQTEVADEVQTAEKQGISEDLSVSVDGAFDALFGDEETVDEKPAETAVEETISEEPAAVENVETPAVAENIEAPVAEETVTEQPIDDEPAAEEPVAEQPVAETSKEKAQEEDLAKEMGGAFASMFGDDDDLALPEEKEASTESAPATSLDGIFTEEPLSQEATSAEIEENAVKDSEFKLESASDFVANESESLFEKSADADFTLNDLSEEPATETAAESATESATESAEVPSTELDSIGSEVSNAFKGLFDEDDSLPESDEPSNKGVDYLMSGDSDDEVSASLVEDADAPLSRGAADLDDSLNTRTLADIYMEQGVYNKALEIYSDLAKKNPDNAEIKSRLEEVQKLCREKFGEN